VTNPRPSGFLAADQSTNDCEPLTALGARVAQSSFRGSSSQQAFDMILMGIQTGILPPGTRLAEIPVGKAIGIGRTPVREALMRLEADGFVVTEPRVGIVVAGNTLQSLAEVYEVREVLEGFAARLAAHYARPGDIFSIRQVLEEFDEPTKSNDTMRLRALNTRFHSAIHDAAHNDQLRRMLAKLHNLIRLSPVSAYDVPGRAEEALCEHWAIFEAVAAHEADKAASLASDHKRRDKEARLAQMARFPLANEGDGPGS
jgi:DNA-binding GntR family transcriptional regulator